MQNASDSRHSAGEDPAHVPEGAVAPAANVRRTIDRWLLVGVGAAGLFITLTIVLVTGMSRRPVESAAAPQTVAARSTPAVPAALVEPTVLPAWAGRRQPVWAADGTKTISFALDAIGDVSAGMSRERPQLVARCLSRRTDVYLVTGPLSFEPQSGSHTVRVRVDDEPEQAQQWLDSEASRELFAPDGPALTERLARAQRLRVGYTPFNARPVTAEFILEGFDQLAPLVARTCGRVDSPKAVRRDR